MCGIAGYLSRPGERTWPDSVLERMTASIAHRGPDGCGFYRNNPAALGHRRLSIVDLTTGSQPMANEDESLWIVYNGEIFNHAALRPDLERGGHRYRSRSDTETILHAFEQHGATCLDLFRGMFAFAIWNRVHNRLFCARDRLGIKPFYYYWDGSLFAFASEIKALLEHPAISPALEQSVLPEYLAFGYVSEERTLFKGIRQLLPGHFLELDLGAATPSLNIRRYWEVPTPDPEDAHRPDDYWIRDLRRRLEETVEMRLMSDVPLGMFLSGGVDSSAIAAIMQRLVGDRIRTFSVGYRESAFSELDYARDVARRLGTDHHEVLVGREEFFDLLPRLIWHEDEPITWPSSVSLYFVSRLAAESVKVVLTGEGSDELFGGYARYHNYQINQRLLRAYRFVPSPLRSTIRKYLAASRLLSASLRRKLQHTIVGRGEDLASLHLDNFYCAFPAAQQRALLASEPAPVYENFLKYWDAAADRSTLGRMLYADQKTYLVELLMKQDRMSMACSIESRVPFLDHTLVEFAARIPDHLKIRGGVAKYVFKKAVEGYLPAEIIHRRKMGFPTPLSEWLSGAHAGPVASALRDPNGILAAFIDPAGLDRVIHAHLSGHEDATDRLWRLLNLQIWGDLFLTGRRERPRSGLLSTAT